MRNQLLLCVALLLMATTTLLAQQTQIYTHDQRDYDRAVALFDDGQLLAAQAIFDEVRNNTNDRVLAGNATYYSATAAVRLNQLYADQRIEEFVQEYPTNPKRNTAYLDIAEYYFNNGKYAYSQKWYQQVDASTLSRKQKTKYNFNNGYALFNSKRYDQAAPFFQKVSNDPEYGSQAKYYLGQIAYQKDDYDQAGEYFEEVGDERLREELTYFQADLNFKLGKFEKAISLAKEQLPKSNRQEKNELNKIIGESLFNLERYDEAIPYLKQYQGRRGKWNNTDYYQLGYAYYKQGQYQPAIDEFSKIIGGQDPVAQNAYYHLAQSYLQSDKKQEALNAFKNASEMEFDATIQEDAGYNYAKLSYEIGNNYTSVPQVIDGYLQTYPSTPHATELNALLLNSYITSRNFDQALQLMESGRGKATDDIVQQVYFYSGLEKYTAGEYQEALTLLKQSSATPQNPALATRAQYWIAESHFQLNDYDAALGAYERFRESGNRTQLKENDHFQYNLGYAHFSKKDYSAAITAFTNYVNQSGDAARQRDAQLRIGDANFVTSKYWPAMEAYNKVIALGPGPDRDYAAFQKAISYGFVQKQDQKLADLQDFVSSYKTSEFYDDALFELGNTLVNTGSSTEGIKIYDRLVREKPQSSYAVQASMRKGLQLYSEQKLEPALSVMKKVVADYPSTQEAVQAVKTARLIYIDLDRVNEYASWVQGIDFYDVTDTELDDAAYASAERQFLENNMAAAVRSLKNYLKDYPNGVHAVQANFYLAQALYAQGDKAETIPYYTFVTDRERNEYTEQSLARLSEVYLQQEQYQEVVPVLQRLETTADFPQNVVFARTNLMKAYHELENDSKAIRYAELVLQNNKIDAAVRSDAQVIIARSALKTGDRNRARTAYAEVEKIATGALAAEALYYKSLFLNEDSKYEQSNQVVQTIARDYSGYKYRAAQSLVVMARNFYGLKDAYQANYVLESVIKNFAQYQDVVDEARDLQQRIQSEEAKTNASVQPQGN